jgi:D-alanine-D-alanine ligase
LTHNRRELGEAVQAVIERYGQAALVEEYVEGREVCISLLGNDPATVLPPVELSFNERSLRVMTRDDRYHTRADEPQKVCPAPLSKLLLRTVEQMARATFAVCHARDYARVDIRLDSNGRPWILEINSMASLGARGSYVRAAQGAGYTFEALVNGIVDVAHQRYFGKPAAADDLIEPLDVLVPVPG